MAEGNSYLGDIHIPLCERPYCYQKLVKLTQELRAKELICVSEYKPYGKYKSMFKRALTGCTFTVLHQCRMLWDRIKNCESALTEAEDKIWTINLDEEVIIPEDNPGTKAEKEDLEFCQFFQEYVTKTLLNDEDVFALASELEKHLHEMRMETQESCVLHESPSTHDIQDADEDFKEKISQVSSGSSSLNMEDIQLSEKSPSYRQFQINSDEAVNNLDGNQATFVQYPDLFGGRDQSQVWVRDVSLLSPGHVDFPYETQDDCLLMKATIDNWNNAKISKEVLMSNVTFMMFKVLPDMHRRHNWIGLICVIASTQDVLQERALTLLELMFLQEQDPDHMADFSILYNAESILRLAMSELLNKYRSSSEVTQLALLQRMSSLYLTMLSQTVLVNKDKSQLSFCGTHFETIRSRPFPNYPGCLECLNEFVLDVDGKTLGKKRTSVADLVSSKSLLTKESVSIQVMVIHRLLRQLFETKDLGILNLFEKFLQPEKKSLFGKPREAHIAAVDLLIRGLVTFLRYGLSRPTDKHVPSLCEKCIQIITAASDMADVNPEMKTLLLNLLCDTKSVVRQKVTDILKISCATNPERTHRVTLGKNKELRDKVVALLREETARLMNPLLSLNGDAAMEDVSLLHDDGMKKQKTHAENFWTSFHVQFDNKPVLALMRVEETKQMVPREDLHLHEMSVLRELQHANVITMFAFQEHQTPVFYIVEDFKQGNLQTALKNSCDTRNFFSKVQLHKFVLDALLALEYCHSKGYIHRNLTAESLFLVAGQQAKLCGFHLACQLKPGQDRIIDQSNPRIPTLWSAPESLVKDEYSTLSDVWMVGHLMYEVLTHGTMPYSHKTGETDERIVRMIVNQIIALAKERCIGPDVETILKDCTRYEPQDRPPVRDIRTRLEKYYKDLTLTPDDGTTLYPAVTVDMWKTSQGYGKGTQRSAGTSLVPGEKSLDKRDFVDLSHTISRHTSGNNYIFLEKIVHPWPSEMHDHIRNGALQDVLPDFRIFQNDAESPHLEIKIPSACRGNLKSLCEGRKLTNSLALYLYCTYKVALILEKLHNLSWALGDLDSAFLYIQVMPEDEDIKVHLVSLAYLQYLDMHDQTLKPFSPESPEVLSRAAPEVVRNGLYSRDSDVYCFGNLLADLLKTYEQGTEGHIARDQTEQLDEDEDPLPGSDVKCDSDQLKSLIKSCLKDRDRPSSSELVLAMKQILINDYKLCLDAQSTVSDGDLMTVASLCSQLLSTDMS